MRYLRICAIAFTLVAGAAAQDVKFSDAAVCFEIK